MRSPTGSPCSPRSGPPPPGSPYARSHARTAYATRPRGCRSSRPCCSTGPCSSRPAHETHPEASALDEEAVERQDEVEEALPHRVRRAARTLLRLAGTFLAVNGMFDERPRGPLPFRVLGKVPVVGVLGGWLDERGGVKKAARATEHALRVGEPDER